VVEAAVKPDSAGRGTDVNKNGGALKRGGMVRERAG